MPDIHDIRTRLQVAKYVDNGNPLLSDVEALIEMLDVAEMTLKARQAGDKAIQRAYARLKMEAGLTDTDDRRVADARMRLQAVESVFNEMLVSMHRAAAE